MSPWWGEVFPGRGRLPRRFRLMPLRKSLPGAFVANPRLKESSPGLLVVAGISEGREEGDDGKVGEELTFEHLWEKTMLASGLL